MNTHDSPITRKMRDQQGLEAALNDGLEDALRRHVQAGVPVVVWRDGKVVELAPEFALAEHLRHKQARQTGADA